MMFGDPYVYPGTIVLRNTLNIRDNDVLRAFEVEASGQRMIQPTPPIKMAAEGYQQLHKHIFQDVYSWAGEIRACTLAKGADEFCRPQFIESEMSKRFAPVQAGAKQMKQSPDASFDPGLVCTLGIFDQLFG